MSVVSACVECGREIASHYDGSRGGAVRPRRFCSRTCLRANGWRPRPQATTCGVCGRSISANGQKTHRRTHDPAYQEQRAVAELRQRERARLRANAWYWANRDRALESAQRRRPKRPKAPLQTDEERRASSQRWYQANRDRVARYQREYQRERSKRPEVRERRRETERRRREGRIEVQGEFIYIAELPTELQPVARLIQETRAEIRARHQRERTR